MSGFLQRLAAGVLHTQRAVHPSVGTIWTAAGTMGKPDAAEPFETSDEVLAPPSPRRADPHAQPFTQQRLSPQMQPGRDAPAPPGLEPTTEQPAQTQMRPERSASIDSALLRLHHEQTATPQETQGETVVFRPLVSLPQRTAFSATRDANEIAAKSEPIPPARLLQTSGEQTSPQPRLIESPRLRAPAADRKEPTAQPDSIEIHIGRIEVLAAPPRPAQPAAPAPARKSLDLGEYLRGERRPR